MGKIVINRELPSLNEYIRAERGSMYSAAEMKRDFTALVFWEARAQRVPERTKPVRIKFTWYTKDRRVDPDNIRFASKFILDGLVKAGILKDDSRKWIKGFIDEYRSDSKNPRVEIEFI